MHNINRPGHEGDANDSAGRQHPALSKANLDFIGHTIVVMSGKGGVGKSTVAVNLAFSLSRRGYRVGLMDTDIHGPSVPGMLGLEGKRIASGNSGRLIPVQYGDNLNVLSIGFLLNDPDDAVIWRGPKKLGAIRQFLTMADWGELDFLIVDSPPGTGDEPLSVCQLVGNADGAVIVTTPQDVALKDVRKSISFCRRLGMPIIGVVENMSGYICPHCGKRSDIFSRGGGEKMAQAMNERYLGGIPLEASVVEKGDEGKPFSDETTAAAVAFERIVDAVVAIVTDKS